MDEIKFKRVNEYGVQVCAYSREQGREQGRTIKIDDKIFKYMSQETVIREIHTSKKKKKNIFR
jgi:hypothetical protein